MNSFFGIIAAALACIDLWCKSYIEKNMQKGEEKPILKGKVSLRKVYNKGMALNVGDKHPEVVRGISGIVCGLLGILSIHEWIKGHCIWRKLGASFTLAGAISNTYDRFARKHVIDYFGFHTKHEKINRITFNLGDMFIFVGGMILMASEIFGKTNK